MSGDWQAISTAPRDGTTIFGANNKLGQRGMVHWNGHEWEMVDGLVNLPMGVGFYPTHWMPLPSPPVSPYLSREQAAPAPSVVS